MWGRGLGEAGAVSVDAGNGQIDCRGVSAAGRLAVLPPQQLLTTSQEWKCCACLCVAAVWVCYRLSASPCRWMSA